MPEPELPDLELLPADAQEFTAEQELALVTGVPLEEDQETQRPYGRGLVFDHAINRYERFGSGLVQSEGVDTLKQWILLVQRVQRGAHPEIFTADFGMDDPYRLISEVLDAELMAEYEQDLVSVILTHDRVLDVESEWVLDDPEHPELYLYLDLGEDDPLEVGVPVAV